MGPNDNTLSSSVVQKSKLTKMCTCVGKIINQMLWQMFEMSTIGMQ